MDYTHVLSATLDEGAQANSSMASYSITYSLDPAVSAVATVREQYTVQSGSVTLSAQLVNASADVDAIFWRAPAFVFDGERNATTTVAGQRLSVCLPGLATHTANVAQASTCSHYELTLPAQGSWRSGEIYASRNGHVRLYSSQAAPPHSSLSLRIEV